MEIKVKPTKQLFFNSDTFFGIYAAEVNPEFINQVELNSYGTISIKGVMPKLNIGEEYIVVVRKDDKSQYKNTYIVDSIRQEKPQTVEEQKAFLETILTENQVKSIFEVYDGQNVVDLILNNEFDFSKVKGLGKKTYEKLRDKVIENVEMSEVLAFLGKYGIKYSLIKKLVKEYGNPAMVVSKVKENPYLLTEINGVGFKTVDTIAKQMGFDLTSPHRIDSCIRHVLSEEASNGHSWTDYKTVLNRCIEYLVIDKAYIQNRLKSNEVKGVMEIDGRYTMKAVYEAEKYIAMKIHELRTNNKKLDIDVDAFLDDYCKENNIQLTPEQRAFFHNLNNNGITLLIGYAGCGKSYLQKILLKMTDKLKLTVLLLSPTGKASKVLSNYVGRPAYTIHKRLGVSGEDAEEVLEITDDVVIVDEASMADVFIIAKLLKSIKNPHTKVVFIGDNAQIPSVNLGNFLTDCIESGIVSKTMLTKVFRQSEGGILDIATKIRKGERFLNDNAEGRIRFGKDCVFHLVDQQYIRDGYIYYYKKALEKYSPEDIVILSPTKKGKLGVMQINKDIQAIVNPPSPMKKEKTFGRDNPVTYRVGDLVMNVVNTYNIEDIYGDPCSIVNGDCGKIIDIDEQNKCIVVEFEQNTVGIGFDAVLTNLIHCYALTKHKSQGSGFKVVICIADRSSIFQLNANLLYTGVTRTQEYLLVLTQARTINQALRKWANMERRSFLKELLLNFDDNAQEQAITI